MNEGYKDSALGKIPQNWDVLKLEQICLPKVGLRRGPFGGAIKKEFFVESGYRVYEQRNAIYDDFDTARYFIDESKYEELKAFKVQANDFIVSCSGTIGRIAKVPKTYKPGVINQALLRIRLNSEKVYDDFFLHQFRFDPFQNKIIDSTQGGAMKNLVGMSEFRKTFVTLPPLPEQQKIAKILSTVDEKINAIDQRIAETQELKKGLMQQLLTKGIGHTQFKDSPLGKIPESWEVSPLNGIGGIITGTTPKTAIKEYYEDSGILWASPADLGKSKYVSTTKKCLSESGFEQTRKLPPKSIMVTCIGSTIGKMGMTSSYMSTNQQINSIVCNDRNSSEFYYYVLEGMSVYLKSMAGTQAVPLLNKTDFSAILIKQPPLNEQTQIAKILISVDEKLQIQEDKKTEYQELKKGLMQQLLTGRIRVKI